MTKEYMGPTFLTETGMISFFEDKYNVEVLNISEDYEENINKQVCKMQIDTTCDKIYDLSFTNEYDKVVLISVERIA